MQQFIAGSALIIVGSLVLLLVLKKPKLFWNWFDMKLLRKTIGEKYTVIVLNIVSAIFIVLGFVLIITA